MAHDLPRLQQPQVIAGHNYFPKCPAKIGQAGHRDINAGHSYVPGGFNKIKCLRGGRDIIIFRNVPLRPTTGTKVPKPIGLGTCPGGLSRPLSRRWRLVHSSIASYASTHGLLGNARYERSF